MTVENQIRGYINQFVLFSDNGIEYDNHDSFLDNGIVDSLAIMDLVLFVEETFGVTIEDHEITPDNFDSVNELAQFIRSKRVAAE
jgi:acyl carrier protein